MGYISIRSPGKYPGQFHNMFGKCPGNIQDMFRKNPGNVWKISRKIPEQKSGFVKEMSRKGPETIRETFG